MILDVDRRYQYRCCCEGKRKKERKKKGSVESISRIEVSVVARSIDRIVVAVIKETKRERKEEKKRKEKKRKRICRIDFSMDGRCLLIIDCSR
jgi:hypothetical protein